MAVIAITPWLAAIVGILSAGLASAYPSLDQYSERNHYRIAAESQGAAAAATPPATTTTTPDDAAFDKQIAGDWPPALIRVFQDGTHEIEFQALDDNREDGEAKINTKNSGDRFNAQADFESNPPRKRSSASLEKESESAAVSLQELLKLWGIDTSKAPTTRAQRGDIEVTEQVASNRGDLPASILYSSLRSKRDVGRKLLWAKDAWGYPEDDGTILADQPDDEDAGVKRISHRRKHQRNEDNDPRRVQERQRMEEERRRQWEEQERRRIDEERREEEQRRRNDVPNRRNDVPNQKNENDSYEARLKKWQREKDEYYRQLREHENNMSRPSSHVREDKNNKSKNPSNVRGEENNSNRAPSNLRNDENDRKLQDYIDKITPIVVGNRPNVPGQRTPQDPRQYEELKRKEEEEYRRRGSPERSRYDDRVRENEEIRRAELERHRQEEERRKLVEQQSRAIEEQRRIQETRGGQGSKRPPQQPRYDDSHQRPISPYENFSNDTRGQPPRKAPVQTDETKKRRPPFNQPNLRWDDKNNQRFHEMKKSDRREDEADRLRKFHGMPVSAQIIIQNTTSNTPPPLLNLRQAVGDEIDFPGFAPAKAGPEAPRFPSPPTRRPPAPSPPACTWAIVVCCKPNKSPEQMRRCFHATDCPGAIWDETACRAQKVAAANSEIMQFYLRGQARSALQVRPARFEV